MPNEIKEVKNNQEVKNAVVTAKMDKDIADAIFNRVSEMEANNQLLFPANYAVGNALKSAYLIIQNTKSGKEDGYRPALDVCTKVSIANALLDMVIQGLNPAKKQCYFIVYGNQLQLMRSYFGEQCVLKTSMSDVTDIYANIIYQDDVVEIGFDEFGKKKILKHETKFENIDKPILGAYSVIIKNGEPDFEIMTMKEIQVSWGHAKTDKVQKEFPQEMAKRTVIKRHCKRFLNTSDDSNLMIVESYNRTTENEYINDEPTTQLELQSEVDTKANQTPLIIEEPTKEVSTTDGPDF